MLPKLQPWLSGLLLLPFLLAPAGHAASAAPQAEEDTPYQAALRRAGDRALVLSTAVAEAPAAARADLRWLIAHMPEPDLQTVTAEFLLENLRLAREARDATAWAAAVPLEIWRDAVLPYAQVNEAREAWRADFRARFAPLVAETRSTSEAARRLNETIFGELGVKYSTKRRRPDQAPSESIELGLASCTGLSILLADACRAVGVPARLAGTANWFDRRGNHTWVEIWDQDGWHFVGAAEPDPAGLDRGWFAGDAARATPGSREFGIWAASWQHTGHSLPMVWAPQIDWVNAVEVTARYLPPAAPKTDGPAEVELLFAVRDARGARVRTELQLRDPQTHELVFTGTTRDDRHDANDFLIARVAPDSHWHLAIHHGEQTIYHGLRVGAEPRQQVLLSTEQEPAAAEADALRSAALRYFSASPEERASFRFDPAFDARLRADPAHVRKLVWNAYRDAPLHAATLEDFRAQRVRHAGHESPYTVKTVGERPEGGWPLVIAMHGGGGTTQEVNDSQWRHMQIYYRNQPQLGIGYRYLALRAPNNTWNGFYDNYVYPLIEALINQQLLFGDANPDKIYAIGYSHGGYGAFAIGPKIPDRFAAVHASAAAPTDGETSAVGLHSLRFTWMIGSRDTAYGRAERCQAFAAQVATLQEAHPGLYPLEEFWIEGHGHGGLPDRDQLRELLPHTRVRQPAELHWELTDPVVRHHYWLQVDVPAKGQRIQARLEDNQVEIMSQERPQLALQLQLEQVDLARPLAVSWNGRVSAHRLEPQLRQLCATLLERGDPRLMSSIRVELRE